MRVWVSAVAVLCAAGLCAAEGPGGGWLTDFEVARQEAAARGVPILANFAGSDWCHWCKKLDQEVLSQGEFLDYARENLVLFLADFPARRKLPEEVRQQNRELQAKYGVQGYPTVLLLDDKGDVLARTGYRPGGAQAYVAHLKALSAERP
jgi:protein disulfide-isomerase